MHLISTLTPVVCYVDPRRPQPKSSYPSLHL